MQTVWSSTPNATTQFTVLCTSLHYSWQQQSGRGSWQEYNNRGSNTVQINTVQHSPPRIGSLTHDAKSIHVGRLQQRRNSRSHDVKVGGASLGNMHSIASQAMIADERSTVNTVLPSYCQLRVQLLLHCDSWCLATSLHCTALLLLDCRHTATCSHAGTQCPYSTQHLPQTSAQSAASQEPYGSWCQSAQPGMDTWGEHRNWLTVWYGTVQYCTVQCSKYSTLQCKAGINPETALLRHHGLV